MDKGAKNKKEAKEEKLKDQKLEEQILKSLEEAPSPEDKFKLLLRKHIESERLSKRLRQDIKTQEKQLEAVLREKENLQREYNRSVLMRDKLQEVCREQQKLIKSVKNESMQKIREEEERRKESQSKFQTSLNEITQSLSKNNEENLKLRDHNIEMTKKLKFLAEQYQTREQQLEKLNEQVQLESQLHQAKLNKVQVEAAMEKEILIKEKQIALEKLKQTQTLLKELTERETSLKEQLHLYTSKYDDFQSSLQKSNDIFATYKVEMEKMSKNTKKLERESLEWKHKWEKSNATLIELATEKMERDERVVRCNKQVEQLQKLLRALQSERTHLYKTLRENNVEVPPLPALPPEPEPIKTMPITSGSADRDKMEMMSKNCAELKQTLANLQNQMKYLNMRNAEVESQTKEVQQQEEVLKKRQKRKQKSKNNKASSVEKELTPSESSETSNKITNNDVTCARTLENEEVEEVPASSKTVSENASDVGSKTASEAPLEVESMSEIVDKVVPKETSESASTIANLESDTTGDQEPTSNPSTTPVSVPIAETVSTI